MGLDTKLEFEKYCKVVRNPKFGHPTRSHVSEAEERDKKGKPATRSHLLKNLNDEFTEINFGRSRSSSCKSMSYGHAGLAGNEAWKRDSMYQSSKEVRKMKKMGIIEGRRKLELARSSDTSLSFRILSSLPQLEVASPFVDQKRPPSLMSLNVGSNPTFISNNCKETDPPDFLDPSFCFPSTPGCVSDKNIPSDGSFNICMISADRQHLSAGKIETSMEQSKFRRNRTIDSLNDGKGILERDTLLTLHKSSSEKVVMPYSPCRPENDHSKANPKAPFSLFRRILNPIMKSKSQRSPSLSVAELGDVTTVGLESIRRNRAHDKFLLNDLLNTVDKTESGAGFVKKDHHNSIVPSSPAHLHGFLKLELKHGGPCFEFSLKDSEDVHLAKTWTTDKTFNWVYTFHSINSQRTSNSSGWVNKERQKDSSMVGQMQVSCFLLSEMRNDGMFDNSMVTEFVLYDIMHARTKLATQERAYCFDSVKPAKVTSGERLVVESNDISDMVSRKLQMRQASGNDGFDASTHYPWAPADLHPNLELAAIVIQVPFEKRESLQDKKGDKLGDKEHLRLFDFSSIDHESDGITSYARRAKVKVVTPSGPHGLPSTEEDGGPSPLLERWRSGGCCDCGGWDMACPLAVFDSPSVQNMVDHPIVENQPPLEFFSQGVKEKMPALSITPIDEGQYSVDFHAQLSKLQAFAICVAMLHKTKGSTVIGQKKSRKGLQCNSLKVLLDEEVSYLIEGVAEK